MSLQEGLIGHWTMDDIDVDTVARNNAGTKFHAETRGSPTFGEDSPVGESVSLNSSDGDYLPIRENFYETVSVPELTVSAWVKTSGNNEYVMQYDRSEVFRATSDVFATNSGSNIDDMGFSGAQDGNWHHVVFWYDSDSSGDTKRVYVDNSVSSSKTDPHSEGALGSTLTTYGSIGAFGESRSFDGDKDASFTGNLSDVRLYERALSEKEINQLYQMRSQKQSNSFFEERFTDGKFGPNWSVSNGTISDNRSYVSNYSFGVWGGGSGVEADLIPYSYNKKINLFEYVWKEDNSQTGHVVILYDKNNNEIMESGTENYQWLLNDGSGGRTTIRGNKANGGYNNWTQFRFYFDWYNGEYQYRLKNLERGALEEGTQQLDNTTGVSRARFTGSGYGSANHCRFDRIRFK